jgi:hypothetical protein
VSVDPVDPIPESNARDNHDDAEASWTGDGSVGRSSIEQSERCLGETVIQLRSKRSG